MGSAMDPPNVIKGFAAVALALTIGGFCLQDWKCGSSCGPVTGGSGDKTMGTYITNYVLAAMAAVMAFLAPSGDNVRVALRVAFGLLAAGWSVRGLMHTLVLDSELHNYLWTAALICLGVGGLWRVYGALVSSQNAGYIKKWTDHKTMMYIFAFISVAFIVFVFLSHFGHISVPDLVMCSMHQSAFCLVLCIVAALSDEVKWALACLCTFGIATYIRIYKPDPFKSNEKFNDTALMNCAFMGYLVATFGLLMALYSKQTTFSKIENKGESMMDSLAGNKGRRCCSCSFK